MKERIDRENKPDGYQEEMSRENSELAKLEADLQKINSQKSTADEHAKNGEIQQNDFI